MRGQQGLSPGHWWGVLLSMVFVVFLDLVVDLFDIGSPYADPWALFRAAFWYGGVGVGGGLIGYEIFRRVRAKLRREKL